MTPQQIAQRIGARRAAEDIWGWLVEGAEGETQDAAAYWQRIQELYAERFPQPVADDLRPMTCQEAANFNLTTVPFGAYEDEYVADVPLFYLCRLCDPSPFINEVKRYLQNPEVKRRIAEDGE